MTENKLFDRKPDWSAPGHGPVWSQLCDVSEALRYCITTNGPPYKEKAFDAITFRQNQIEIWIGGTKYTLDIHRPKIQHPPPLNSILVEEINDQASEGSD